MNKKTKKITDEPIVLPAAKVEKGRMAKRIAADVVAAIAHKAPVPVTKQADDDNDDLEQDWEDEDLVPDFINDEGGREFTSENDSHLPAVSERLPNKSVDAPLAIYLKEISRYKVLPPEEEQRLAKKLLETGDIEVAKELVKANLRLVVKIAMEYRHAYHNVLDLIQEGNIGLMKAVSKFDPGKGAKLSYYASWWIRSYILKFILDNFRLVKIGTTQEQKKLFYNLMREKERLIQMGINPEVKLLSENLGVSDKAVVEMDKRLGPGGGEFSLDKPLFDELNSSTLADTLASDEEEIDDKLSNLQGLDILKDHLGAFLSDLKERDREIFHKRLLSEVPPSLQTIADEYGVSRERIRQIEEKLINKLKVYMSEFIR